MSRPDYSVRRKQGTSNSLKFFDPEFVLDELIVEPNLDR